MTNAIIIKRINIAKKWRDNRIVLLSIMVNKTNIDVVIVRVQIQISVMASIKFYYKIIFIIYKKNLICQKVMLYLIVSYICNFIPIKFHIFIFMLFKKYFLYTS